MKRIERGEGCRGKRGMKRRERYEEDDREGRGM